MNTRQKINLIQQNTEEVLSPKDLQSLINTKTPLKHYIGFEISGLIHLGNGLLSMGKVADFLKSGIECNIFLADWHTYINDKLGGDWAVIKKTADAYFKEALIACLECFGVKAGQVNFILASDLYTHTQHWQNLMEVSKNTTLSRIKRSVDITGRRAGEGIDFAKLIYPPLQVADIFSLGVNIVHAGMDQRKVHVIARKVAKNLKISPLKNAKGEVVAPVAIHHSLIYGLQKPPIWPIENVSHTVKASLKMSKSKPGSCVFIHDHPEAIRAKIQKAFCPPQEVGYNPIINWAQHLIFWNNGEGELKVSRSAKFGGQKTYQSIKSLKTDYRQNKLHPLDLKNAVADWLIVKLEPVRKRFQKSRPKQSLMDLEKFIATLE